MAKNIDEATADLLEQIFARAEEAAIATPTPHFTLAVADTMTRDMASALLDVARAALLRASARCDAAMHLQEAANAECDAAASEVRKAFDEWCALARDYMRLQTELEPNEKETTT